MLPKGWRRGGGGVGRGGWKEEEDEAAATTQLEIVGSDSFLRDSGLLPRPGLGLQPPAKGLCRRLAILEVPEEAQLAFLSWTAKEREGLRPAL